MTEVPVGISGRKVPRIRGGTCMGATLDSPVGALLRSGIDSILNRLSQVQQKIDDLWHGR